MLPCLRKALKRFGACSKRSRSHSCLPPERVPASGWRASLARATSRASCRTLWILMALAICPERFTTCSQAEHRFLESFVSRDECLATMMLDCSYFYNIKKDEVYVPRTNSQRVAPGLCHAQASVREHERSCGLVDFKPQELVRLLTRAGLSHEDQQFSSQT